MEHAIKHRKQLWIWIIIQLSIIFAITVVQ